MGKGVFCTNNIKKFQFITEYTGEVFKSTDGIFERRLDIYNSSSHTYLINLTEDGKFVIDAT